MVEVQDESSTHGSLVLLQLSAPSLLSTAFLNFLLMSHRPFS